MYSVLVLFSLFEAIRKLSEIIRSIYEVTIFVSTYPLSFSHPTADGEAVEEDPLIIHVL